MTSIPRWPAALLAAVFALGAPSGLAAQSRARSTIEVAAERDALTNDYADWTSEAVRLHLRASARAGLLVAGEHVERFGLADDRLQAELSLPLGGRLTLAASGEASETHHVLPRSGYGGRLHMRLGGGWGVEGGASFRDFDAAEVRGTSLALERYFSRFLASYGYAKGKLNGADVDFDSHQGRLSVFFGDRGSITLGGSTGREAESLGGAGVLVMDVESAAVWGVLPLGAWLDLTWAAGTTTQGDLYTRSHLALGARLRLR